MGTFGWELSFGKFRFGKAQPVSSGSFRLGALGWQVSFCKVGDALPSYGHAGIISYVSLCFLCETPTFMRGRSTSLTKRGKPHTIPKTLQTASLGDLENIAYNPKNIKLPRWQHRERTMPLSFQEERLELAGASQ